MKMKRIHRMTVLACVAVLFAWTAVAQGAGEGQWINLFDGESLYGWNVVGNGNWSVNEGQIEMTEGDSGFIATTSQFADFELTATLRVTGQGGASVAFRAPASGHVTEEGGAVVYLPAGERDADYSTVQVRAVGGDIQATVNGQAVEAPSTRSIGYIAIQLQKYHRDRRGPRIEVKEIKLRPLSLRPIFNGQNLDGWNILPDKKSVFSVVDGALNIKDGNGQIETAETFRDFILQLDIISNGDHLNSGVFFRSPVGVFWKGYEAQVRNEWARDDRTKPVDYGTGGMYGLNMARKVVSSDHEWFTMTVSCLDNHMAVWVNGYQVSDFTDTRAIDPEGDGKNGYVTAAGTITLQGHDPTTDLSFKNINIQTCAK